MDIVLRAIALMQLKLGYPVKLSNTCQTLLNIHVKTPKSFFGLSFALGSRMFSGPEMAAISKSATVRLIIKYVLHLRRWRLLAKTTRVKALIINIMINSVSHTAIQMSIVALIDIL